ncbi:MAG: hypothetical protein ACI9VR_003107, partial [Cognaticolwellia sp.]
WPKLRVSQQWQQRVSIRRAFDEHGVRLQSL